MKKAKLQKLMLQAKEAHSKKAAALRNLSQNVVDARNEFTRSKLDLKTARRQHKEMRKRLRKLEKALKINQADRQEAQESFARLEKKWRKLNKNVKQAASPAKKAVKKRPQKPAQKAARKTAQVIRKQQSPKTDIKVVAPAAAPPEALAAT